MACVIIILKNINILKIYIYNTKFKKQNKKKEEE